MPHVKPPIVDEEVNQIKKKSNFQESETKYSKTVMNEVEVEEEYENHLIPLLHWQRNEFLKKSILRNMTALSEMSEEEIVAEAKPTPTDQLLRIAFWEEVKKAERGDKTFMETHVWKGVCTHRYWQRLVREYDMKMKYILTPVRDRVLLQKTIHQQGLINLLKIANADPFTKGQLDPRKAKSVIDAWKLIDDRMYGQAVQRVQTEKLEEPVLSPKELTKEISKLREEVSDTPLTIDVSSATTKE